MARTVKKFRLKRFFSSPLKAGMLLIVFVALLTLALELTNVTHIFHKLPANQVVVTAGKPVSISTPTTSQPVQKNSSGPGSTVAQEPGSATDTNGSASTSTSSSQWVTSKSGVITVKQPSANSTLHNGDSLVGTAKTSQINYRLKDNKVGVISQGTLNVVNGSFSGILHFTPHGTGGQLDIFTTDSQGIEYNEVQINVGF